MHRANHPLLAAALALALTSLVAGGAWAQGKKIVCWKDKDGKTIGCGDTVPPEYQGNATKELDKRGITRKVTETAEERAKREAQEKQLDTQKAEEKKRVAEQRRQDQALLNTFTNEQEIDLKRDRDLQVVDGQINQLRVMQKNAASREKEMKDRIATGTKSGKPATEAQKEDLARAEADRVKAEQTIAAREKDKQDLHKRYGEMKERYTKLRSGAVTAGSLPAAAPTTAAAKK